MDGLDVILSGHTHNRLDRPWFVNGALLIQSGCHGSFLGRLDLDLAGRQITAHRHALIAIDDSLPSDPVVDALVQNAVAETSHLHNDIVGHSAELLHRMTCLDAPMDDVLLDAIAAASETQIAFSNGWRYGAPIPPGPVTAHDLACIVPTDPPIETVHLTGAEIVEMMEQNLEATFCADPFGQRGGYVKRFRGLTLNVKLENPPMRRIEMAFGPDGGLLDQDASYRCAFITMQGVPQRFGEDRSQVGVSATEALRLWFVGFDRANPEMLGRLRVV
ncbi:5'-nucleotidase C-terminal domain-containing protein [Paracoccus sp. TK19116]|uniref:5'-nucleotidase C-terminal domain-containing protein n=1 Tax=Paracoccus albicereus TaxID=2922394 RepID=A0ABT1MW85_9RHOB|nr:5'-nucleotidase C-terminal domain-containing protein [Paracoccus albicereus]MCQ0971944.1 5'-nucleotidase C-terminal domain-containing protein [Paracoccus albicereus]